MSLIDRILSIFKKKEDEQVESSVTDTSESDERVIEDANKAEPESEAESSPSDSPEMGEDKWTETRRLMSMLSPEEYSDVIEENRKSCVCPTCPSYIDCAEGGKGLFCCVGRSGCITEAEECLCGSCPVREMMGLKHSHYCIKGDEASQRGF